MLSKFSSRRAIPFLFLLLSTAPTFPETREEGTKTPSDEHPKPWDHLGANLVNGVVGWPLAFHAAGGLSAWYLVESGADAATFRIGDRQDPVLNGLWTAPGLIASSFTPLIAPLSLYVFSDSESWKTTGAVATQAVGIAFLYNNILKAATGRPPPDRDRSDPERNSREFNFGFLRGGVFHGWPSGHTMVNTAMATSVASYHRDHAWAMPAALAYSTYVGAAMTFGDRGGIHWLSDATAAMLMGFAIGWTVGDGFYQARAGKSAEARRPSRLSFLPVAGEAQGMVLIARF